MKNEKNRVRYTVIMGISAALCLLLSYIEFVLPPIYAALPAVKCGLGNIAVVFALYRLGPGSAAVLAALKVLLTAMLFGTFPSLAYSAAGALLSLCVMLPLSRAEWLSAVGVSVAGGVAHNVGQIIMAVLLLGRVEIALYLPVLTVSGTLAGVAVGLIGGEMAKRVKL